MGLYTQKEVCLYTAYSEGLVVFFPCVRGRPGDKARLVYFRDGLTYSEMVLRTQRCARHGLYNHIVRGDFIQLYPHSLSVSDHHKRCKQIHDEVCAVGYNPRSLFVLLLNTAQFEFLLKEVKKVGCYYYRIIINYSITIIIASLLHHCNDIIINYIITITSLLPRPTRCSRSSWMRSKPSGRPTRRRAQRGWLNWGRCSLGPSHSPEWRRTVLSCCSHWGLS